MELGDDLTGAFRTHNGLDKTHLSQGAVRDVDDILTSTATKTNGVAQKGSGSKLDHAKEVGHKTEMELRALCEGLDNRVREIGITVAEAQNFQGRERILNGLGKIGISWAKNKADVLRHDRLQTLDLHDAVKEIQHYVVETVKQLGESEADYKLDSQQYKAKIDEVLNKQTEAMPRYLDVQTKRQKLEVDLQNLQEELKAGTVDQASRPEKERKIEEMQRIYDGFMLEEKTLGAIVKEAKEALPELQKSREASNQSIQSLHAMRQGLLEKFNNLDVVLERAVTAMKAAAKADLYKTVDPAFNKAIEVITENNVATAGGLLETWAERMKHAAIDPEASQRLLNELLGHISDAAKDLTEIEDKINK